MNQNPISGLAKSSALPYDVNMIMSILPHRYPFLLVDRIVAFDGEKKMVGLKNVTINEPFFQGHFPGAPIMPGVLIIEAMAQVSGILLSHQPGNKPPPENTPPSDFRGGSLGLFMSINGAKFRKPVVPGDQLRLEVELKRFGGRIAVSLGKAYVEEEVVAEAEMMFGFAPPMGQTA